MIRKKQPKSEIVIDLTGPDGNAFVLMAFARKLARETKLVSPEKVVREMMMGDYENLVEVFDHYFGSFVILER